MFSTKINGSFYNGSIIISPPKKISKSFYKCDTIFHLDTIVDMYDDEVSFGIVFISGEICTCDKIVKTGSHLEIVKVSNLEVRLMKNQKKGGSSSARIGRIRQGNEEHQIKNIVELIQKSYLIKNNTEYTVKGLVLAGPAELKNKVKKNSVYEQYFDKITMGIINTDDSDTLSIYHNNIEMFITAENENMVNLISKIKNMMQVDSDKLVFGLQEAVYNMEISMLETLAIAKSTDNHSKKLLNELNKCCNIIEIEDHLMNSIGLDIVGIKWY